ncbi:hypothetical protein HYV49_04445 [Candidatus Pacearchaeota archaeon]|nr:hypothetical protein [Candidatus Pacearchaeota archaeon]
MKLEEHEKAYAEHFLHIDRTIEEGLEENQRNIGYNVSQGSIELLAIYLHKLNFLQGSGDQFDHRIFRSKNLIEKKVPAKFPAREEILKLLQFIESERIALCYGSRKSHERVKKVVNSFQKLRKIINENLKNASKR